MTALSTPFPGNHPLLANTTGPIGGAGSPANASTLCPQCDSPLSGRITDEDTQMSYPCDDGEGFCEACDALWTDAELIESPAPRNLPTMEEVQSKIAEVFNPLWKPKGWSRVEA